MTIITGKEYNANQGKYIKRAQEGERVIISSKGIYVELKPVSGEDKAVRNYTAAKSFLAASGGCEGKFDSKEYTTLKTHEDVRRWFDSL